MNSIKFLAVAMFAALSLIISVATTSNSADASQIQAAIPQARELCAQHLGLIDVSKYNSGIVATCRDGTLLRIAPYDRPR